MKKLILGAVLGLLLVSATSAGAMPKYEPHCLFSGCGGVSADGKRAIFTFDEPLDMLYPGSGPHMVYKRVGGQTRALFDFPEGKARPVTLLAVSDNARRTIVQTRSPLTENDTDGFGDDYFAIQDGVPELLSWDPADPATASSPTLGYSFSRASDDARTVYFTRSSRQGDNYCSDTLARTSSGWKTVALGCFQAIEGASRDGRDIYFNGFAGDPLSGSRWAGNLYRLRDGAYTMMMDLPATVTGLNCSTFSRFGDATADGETMLFSTNQKAAPADQDDDHDIYLRRPDGSLSLLTDSPDDGGDACMPKQGTESDHPIGLSSDGSRALFATQARLAPEDTDSAMDAYLHVDGQAPTLITTGPTDDNSETRNPAFGDKLAGWDVLYWRIDASDDLTAIAFDTRQRLVPEDTDDSIDVYLWRDGETELVSTGPTASGAELDAKLFGISNDGSQVAFSTREALVAVDTDNRMDIYSRSTGHLGQLEGEEDEQGLQKASASVSAVKQPKRRTRLISAESIAPRMKVVGKVALSGRRAAVRLRCPKAERSGPCRGVVRIRVSGRKAVRGSTRFRVRSGKTARLRIGLNRKVRGRKGKAKLRIKAADRLGNTARSTRRIAVR